MGFNEEGKNKSYSLTYDAKSTAKNRIAAATAHLSGLRRHREVHKADFSLEVAIDYQGADDDLSAISIEAKMKGNDDDCKRLNKIVTFNYAEANWIR